MDITHRLNNLQTLQKKLKIQTTHMRSTLLNVFATRQLSNDEDRHELIAFFK